MRRLFGVLVLLASGMLLAIAASAATGSARAASACTGSMVVSTKSYVFALTLGPFQGMYTQAEVKAKHLKSGEVMVSGQMMGMHGSMSSERHLEVHICARGSGKVVTAAHPTISFEDLSAKTAMKMTMVPVAAMYGISQGRSDYHYGNNVAVTAGHRYQATVKLSGQSATFKLKIAKM